MTLPIDLHKEINGQSHCVAGVGTTIQNNEFEGNGGSANVAIRVRNTAVDTRILSNFYSGDCLIDAGSSTRSAFDIYFFSAC